MKKKIVFLCGARDFHAMDWYKSAKSILNNDVSIITDLIESEGFPKIIDKNDQVYKMLILDKLLLNYQCSFGNRWRNILKLIVLPIQAIFLKIFDLRNKNCIYYAHSMYYLVLARLAGVDYVGTPQGSDILIKPYTSNLYKLFAIYGLKKATFITVDSTNMQVKIKELTGKNSYIIQNGINIEEINKFIEQNSFNSRSGILSIRGFTDLYNITEIIKSRNELKINVPISFIYPFFEAKYRADALSMTYYYDLDFGRMDKFQMYSILTKTKLVISIPKSDSSPRSVYEAIFCGAPVAIVYNEYYKLLPNCMKKRIIIVNLEDRNWLTKALIKADEIIKTPYNPSIEAINLFSQKKSCEKIIQLILS